MATPAERALDAFFQRLTDWHGDDTGHALRVPFDPDWPSPAQFGDPDSGGQVAWTAVRQSPPCSFADLENALELSVHPDAWTFYTRYFGAHVDASFQSGNLSLLFPWNEEDFRLVTGNLIGHALEKRRVRQPFTVFFANIDDGRFLSIDNDSGKVMLEVLGARKPYDVADSLAGFLDRLDPPVPA